MMKCLHILNGDSTLHQMDQTDIEGDRFVWREILCEGEVDVDVGSKSYWEKREAFLTPFSEENTKRYLNNFKQGLNNLKIAEYSEITLWFEFDLFCQINMLAVLSWIFKNKKQANTDISLVCLGHHPNYSKLVGLGEIKPKEFTALHPDRKRITQEDLAFAHQVWGMYAARDFEAIPDFIRLSNRTNFMYLEAAMEKQIKRIPDENGLNELERLMLVLINQEDKTKRDVVGAMLQKDDGYGFGDLQYFKMYDKLMQK